MTENRTDLVSWTGYTCHLKYSISPNDYSSSPQKRKRTKCLAACESCQIRKSRCDLLTARGCHRCSVLGIECSLNLIVGVGSGPQIESYSQGLRQDWPVSRSQVGGAQDRPDQHPTLTYSATTAAQQSLVRPSGSPLRMPSDSDVEQSSVSSPFPRRSDKRPGTDTIHPSPENASGSKHEAARPGQTSFRSRSPYRNPVSGPSMTSERFETQATPVSTMQLQESITEMKKQTVEILSMMRQITGMRNQMTASGQLQAALSSIPGAIKSDIDRTEQEKEQASSTSPVSNALPDSLERSIYGTMPRRGAYQQVIKALDLPAPDGIHDPVRLGVVSMQEMSAAWQM